jgi:hypothetical protein
MKTTIEATRSPSFSLGIDVGKAEPRTGNPDFKLGALSGSERRLVLLVSSEFS